MSMNIFELAVD